MNTDHDLNYRLYLQREEGFRRIPISSEYEKYNAVSSGNVERVKENFLKIKENYYNGKGVLSDDPVKNVRYHFIISTRDTLSAICNMSISLRAAINVN